jgi:hypothetical protein
LTSLATYEYLPTVIVQHIRSHSKTMRALSLLVLIAVTFAGRTPAVLGFSVSTKTVRTNSIGHSYGVVYPCRVSSSKFALQAAPDDNDKKQEDKLSKLGYSSKDVGRSRKESDKEQLSVNVNIPDVDPLTLTAVGFGLIAFNFFVLANSGDGGIGGVVARIINYFDSL